jgi:hypothetical protein
LNQIVFCLTGQVVAAYSSRERIYAFLLTNKRLDMSE